MGLTRGRSLRSALILTIALFAVLTLVSAPIGQAFSSSKGSNTYQHPYPTGLKPGDIVIGHTPGLVDDIIPGYWTHTGLVAYYDPVIGDWIVVEAMPGSGVHLVTLSEFLSRYDTVAVLRVDTSDSVRSAAVSFALDQLGKPYDYFWLSKEVYGSSYYCSELVWASYKAVGGPDLDANPGWSWTYAYGVAPQEIYDDSNTYVIYYDSA
ncbi:MAG: hypothetical protein LRS48_06340 [Desulfurococcales archaeon]|nr:hypothetical protein [Desulfurococcales archaeon]